MSKSATASRKGKSKEGVNKAALVREALEKLGLDAPAKAVQDHAAAQGVEIAPAQISNIRTKLKDGGPKKKKKGRKAKAPTAGRVVASNGSISADDLIQARIMADKVGGVEKAKILLDLLNKLR